MLKDLVCLVRPRHWLKNSFVALPLVFAATPDRLAAAPSVALTFVMCCLLASAVYCFNDVLDAHADRANPRKRQRPVAAGRIAARTALVAAALLAIGATMLAAAWLTPGVTLVALLYLANNLLYTLVLKHHAIADVMSIALGFVLRVLAGALAIPVTPSSWLLVCGFSLALFLAFGKRRAELGLLGSRGEDYRLTLQTYTTSKVDVLLAVSASLTLLSYMLYTVSPETQALHHTDKLIYTIPFVAYGVFRFIFKVQEARADGPVEVLTSDWLFSATGVLWVISVATILWIR